MIKMCKTKTVAAVVLAAALLTAAFSAHAAVTVALSPPSGAPGTAVTITGAAGPDTWVAVKVLDETGSIVFFDTVESDGTGAYSCIFKAPDLPPGPLTVIVGYDTDVSQVVFTLLRDATGSDLPGTGGGGLPFLVLALLLVGAGVLVIQKNMPGGWRDCRR